MKKYGILFFKIFLRIFGNFFLIYNFLIFLKNYCTDFDLYVLLLYLPAYFSSLFLTYPTLYILQKILFLTQIFGFSRKLPSKIWEFGINRKHGLWEVFMG